MASTPVEVPDAVFAALKLRYDDAQIVELTSAIAWENYRARFDHALGVEAEGYYDPPRPRASRDVGGPGKGAFCPLPQTKTP
jgi:hypothetical protein